MTQDEWISSADPTPMLIFLRDRASDRKMRLFACAVCRRIWGQLRSDAERRGLDVAECAADDPAADDDRDAAHGTLEKNNTKIFRRELRRRGTFQVVRGALCSDSFVGAEVAAEAAAISKTGACSGAAWEAERLAHADLLRDVIGNPFRRVAWNRRWLISPVIALACTMYESRDFAAMPISAFSRMFRATSSRARSLFAS